MAKGLALLIILVCLLSCVVLSTALEQARAETAYSGRKILWVDSYDLDYEWSRELEQAIVSVLEPTGVELLMVHMNTKSFLEEELKREAGLMALESVHSFAPDVVIASDDNAQKYFVAPYLMDSGIPVVFCGVNWDASEYGYPTETITGMVEVDLPLKVVEHMSRFAAGDRIGFLSDDTLSTRKVLDTYQNRFFNHTLNPAMVSSFAEFKSEFLRLREETDMIIFYNFAAIAGWDDDQAREFLLRETRTPTGTVNPHVAPYVIFTVEKFPSEHGAWAARTALEILDGRSPADIPMAENLDAALTVNLYMAEALGILIPLSTLKAATVIGPGSGNQNRE